MGRLLEIVLPEGCGTRLDKALAAAAPEGLSRSRLQALIAAGAVRGPAGDVVSDPKAKVKPGEAWTVTLPDPAPARAGPEPIALAIIHEDAELIVIDKPAGMVVHPAPGAETGTLVNALLAHCGESLAGIGGESRPGIVHRIDKDTSGLLVVAKTDRAHHGLSAQLAAHTVERMYLALAHGVPDPGDPRLMGLAGVTAAPPWIRIEAPIARHRTDRKRMAVVEGGRRAVTRVRPREALGAAALIECRLETGRTHQIRVHMAHVGHPLIGDPVYGRGRSEARLPEPARGFPRQALHAALLGFEHPATGRTLRFESPLPRDMHHLLVTLQRNGRPHSYIR